MRVLITGGTKGIGKRTVIKFASLGYDVIFTYYQDQENAINLKKELETKYNTHVTFYKLDLAKEEDINNLVEEIYKEGFLDVLVNNAAIANDQDFTLKTKHDFLMTLDTDLVGPYLLARKVGLKMFDRKEGSIINISSTNGLDTTYPESIDYDAAKAGLISLTHNLANYFAPYLRVNAIAPGWVNTEMNKGLSPDFKDKETAKILLNRFAEPSEIANLISFLASREASYINDSVIRIDGGIKR